MRFKKVVEIGEGVIFAGVARARFIEGDVGILKEPSSHFHRPHQGEKAPMASGFCGVGTIKCINTEGDASVKRVEICDAKKVIRFFGWDVGHK